ncbi:DEAD/DEAH box helicase family protein [Micromonospora sp. DPT]|uniref:sacsin N-terminal ATP-binding-like domain-containing protein n=1 Tax=Micromonospora sp. DPT TaxID=3142975 RepID=UPI00320B58AB
MESDANIEIQTAQGGYGRKQIYELVQNGADAMKNAPGRIEVRLTRECLYVANEGTSLTEAGVATLLSSHVSRKRSDEIGRFGLGFKSVVALSDTPQIFSRSGSLGFDRHDSAARIREVVPSAPKFPLLRLARSLDPAEWAARDEALAELMGWARTVVRLPLKHPFREVANDLQSFPGQFVLFSPHVLKLVLDNRIDDDRRTISLSVQEDGSLLLADRAKTTRWRVVRMRHRPTAGAARDAGELAARDEVEVQWAVPLTGASATGSFWAFFPTESYTTLSGVVNAPWKLSDDRRHLLPGAFNEELLTQVLPRLVAQSLPALVDPDNPAAVLDLLPARGRESRSWADEVINQPIMRVLADSNSLPDVEGRLRRPDQLRLHPEEVQQAWLTDWRESCPEPAGWVHHDVSGAERRAKADRLMGGAGERTASLREWIEALVTPPGVATCTNAICLVARVVQSAPALKSAATEANVLLLDSGELRTPKRGHVFVRGPGDADGPDFIDPALAEVPAARRALESLGITILDRSGELRHALSAEKVDWPKVWNRSRGVAPELAAGIFRELVPEPLERNIQVRTSDGQMNSIASAFLAGEVVPSSGERDRAFLIDPRFHARDLDLLRELGAVGAPVIRHGMADEIWLRALKDLAKERYVKDLAGRRIELDRVDVSGPTPPWPLQPLTMLSPEGRAALTEAALIIESGDSWTVRHVSDRSLPTMKVRSLTMEILRRHGYLRTNIGPWPVGECLVAGGDLDPDVLPAVGLNPRNAEGLRLKTHPSDLSADAWARLFEVAASWADPERRFRLYAWAAFCKVGPPRTVKVTVGSRQLPLAATAVAVTTDRTVYESLQAAQVPAMLVPEGDQQYLIESWSVADGADMLQEELVVVADGTAEVLVDLFPPLKLYLPRDQFGIEIQRCTTMEILTSTPSGQVSRRIASKLQDGRVLVTGADDTAVLAQVIDELRLDVTPQSILRRMEEQKQRQLRAKVRQATDDEQRLILAVGSEALLRNLPRAAVESLARHLGRELDDRELAKLAFSVHGYGVLQQHRAALEANGLEPPTHWAGSSPARLWVTQLGFPKEYAGFSDRRPPASLEVDGPADLPELHDYQRSVASRIKGLVRRTGGRSRGLVALPTGAGKTRVAVQALVEQVRDGELGGLILWIAESTELCEQAVQAWSHVWRAIGPTSRRLAVARLWGTYEVQEDPENFQVVIASVDKLRNKIGATDYQWLTGASLIVVDEAHGSIAPTYTAVFNWLSGTKRVSSMEIPLLGLTATPFRNTNVEETTRLVERYQRNRLDEGVFKHDAYAELQDRRILARVRQRLLTGADISATPQELEEISKYRRVSASMETRLAGNEERNLTIVDSICGLEPDWTVLLFATSVDNARALAALLTFRGVPSVAIDAETDSHARRRYIEDFLNKKIRVITNYNVLTQGFDAPAVRAVYVTRPTFSPNLYQQMVGRGLRGTMNGGSDEVLIVNVADNIVNYGERLAFHDFDYLWSESDAS